MPLCHVEKRRWHFILDEYSIA